MLISSQPNVLVDTTGRVRITDIGLAMVTRDLGSIRSGSAEHGHSARWMAPEILDDRGSYSKEGDIFSFAMVTIEVRCRYPTRGRRLKKKPFLGYRLLLVSFRLVTNGIAQLC